MYINIIANIKPFDNRRTKKEALVKPIEKTTAAINNILLSACFEHASINLQKKTIRKGNINRLIHPKFEKASPHNPLFALPFGSE
jgi:hypothetical protein